MNKIPSNLIIDVDGVMTTGQFIYSNAGKQFKIFGAHDSDGLKLLKNHFKITFITADKRGYRITKKRIVDDLEYDLKLISEEDRYEFCNKIGFKKIIFIGDGIHDAKILKKCFFGIAPKNARIEAKNSASYITPSRSAEGAVLDAAKKILKILKLKN
mgnify:CR=1 FL=1|tara:strand:+ start:479 stop:949 length:471 start_codon:yes stop_codon:yes gene_type:complete